MPPALQLEIGWLGWNWLVAMRFGAELATLDYRGRGALSKYVGRNM